MKRPKIVVALTSTIISMLVVAIVFSLNLSIGLYNKSVSGNGAYGEISLRSYYECGSGSINDPYVITRPRHLYNLSRLQGLGVYGEKTYFKLGKEELGGVNYGTPMCYADDSSSVTKPYLDMSSSTRTDNPINAIGSEALPFYGVFDGQNVEIKNLHVYANPEDAGLFGYTAHQSKVENLFLDNITIHATGYTSEYDHLYSPESTIGNNAYYDYNPNNGSAIVPYKKNNENTIFTKFYANNLEDFEYTTQGSDNVPILSINADSTYTFSSLLSGDLIKFDEEDQDQIIPNLEEVFGFFKSKREEEDASFPIQASSTASLIVTSVDRYGQKHSKVLLTVEYDFTLESETTNFISLGVRVGKDHDNNIGLVVGHCDGTVENCYVHDGSFIMNDGGEGYRSLANGSNMGLIGRVGGTVENVLAYDSDVGAKDGKNIGVLDFTTIYRDAIDDNSFDNSVDVPALGNCVSYEPVVTSKYIDYLRSNNGQYITKQENSLNFLGRKIITNTDLGVFTIATDTKTSGRGGDAGQFIDDSLILSESGLDDVDENYWVYYATGEYSKAYNNTYTGISFKTYMESFSSRTNTTLLSGYHLPQKDQLSRESFETREAKQNYFFRFKLDPNYRKGKGFYFSDVDTTTDGGAFLANYFSYKLVDQNGYNIGIGENKCGVMLKNNLRQDISSFSASFACPDLSPNFGDGDGNYSKCLEDAENEKYVSNMINFEISSNLANVTIVAAPSDNTKPSALGVYKLDNNDFVGENDYQQNIYNMEFRQKYNEPDYAFFMPTDSNFAYFDYKAENGSGQIGVRDSSGNFSPANNTTEATVPAEYNKANSEYGRPQQDKPRLFAHTFCLPKGRYCIGSASRVNNNQCVPKVYYLCAQGQDNGQFDFDDNVFKSNDRVENVDFVNVPRFNNDGTANIVVANIETYNPSSPTDGNKLGNRRCYIALVNSDRSEFASSLSNLSFTYDPQDGKFKITSTSTSAITHLAIDNYQPSLSGETKHLTVVLFGNESDGEVIVYPAGN